MPDTLRFESSIFWFPSFGPRPISGLTPISNYNHLVSIYSGPVGYCDLRFLASNRLGLRDRFNIGTNQAREPTKLKTVLYNKMQ